METPGKLTHSHSQPGGMDRTPPGTPKKAGKMLAVRVQMLDDTITMFQVQAKALGRVLFDQVCNQLHLLESDYFGLEYQELGGTKYWLDLEKPLSRQIGLSLVDTLVRFCVKFYTPDPSQLEEEFTRYLFCLQIKRDLSQGLLQCNSNTAALMASYIVQAECGDYVVEDYPDHRYLSSYKFVPNQDQELERKIMENHKKHTGQSPAEADLNLLETARRCELYGIKMHPAKDHEGAPLNLAVAHMGIVVFQNFSKINTFSWAKIRKISFKRKKFLVKLHPEGYGHYKDTVEFFFEGRNECKNFWKKCVENHGFFRCSMVKKVPRQKTRVLSRGSSFRYSGRTQKQIVDFVRENYVKRQTFQRSQSFRHSSSAHSSVANVGTSISAHPLLPLGDNAVAGTPVSLSCGSMTLTSSPLHTADIHAGGSPSPPLTTSVSPGTSVTSSPQHFYPQEIPYRRAGHQLTKAKRHQVRSHHAISPLQSPTNAATAVSNLSANLSNYNSNDKINSHNSGTGNSRISLKSLDYANINDVYSNFYSSLRSLRNNADDNDFVENETKTEICSLSNHSSNAVSKSNESIRVSSKKSKPPVYNKTQEFDRCAWYRSASCKDLCHDENVTEVNKNEENSREYSTKQLATYREGNYNREFDSPVTLYDDSRRKCYSAITSKNPSVDRVDDVITSFKIYSRSYPGTTSSLSIESPERGSYDRIIEMMSIKCDSQEEMLLSQDDLSHDSYELLERELYDFDSNGLKNKGLGLHSERNRSKSCSWESEKTIKSLNSRSTENILNRDYVGSLENGFWSLEGERSPKHKSEIDFRSLDRKFPKEGKLKIGNKDGRWTDGKCGTSGRRKKNRGALDCDFKSASQTMKRSENIGEEVFKKTNILSELGNQISRSTVFREKELYKDIEHESGLYLKNMELELKNANEKEKKQHEDERKSQEDFKSLRMNLTEEYFKGKQLWVEERRKIERKREKIDIEERFHEGIREKEKKEWEKEKERRQMERRKNNEEKLKRNEEETTCRMLRRSSDQTNVQEGHFIKFDRVVSNQFGKYSEFLDQKNSGDTFFPEKKFLEGEEVVCHMSVLPNEQERKDRNYDSETLPQNIVFKKIQKDVRKDIREEECRIHEQPIEIIRFQEHGGYKKNGLTNISAMISKNGKVLVERTKSDPYNCGKNPKRNVLTHQKSIDLTPQQSEETQSDYDNDDGLKKTSRSEHDIPYILHKRHCMNGTAKNSDLFLSKNDDKCAVDCKLAKMTPQNEVQTITARGVSVNEEQLKQLSSKTQKCLGQKFPSSKLVNGKKSGVQIINLDVKNERNLVSIIEPHKNVKGVKHPLVKRVILPENRGNSKVASKVEKKRMEPSKSARSTVDKGKKETIEFDKKATPVKNTVKENEISHEPIYAEVCKDTIAEIRVIDETSKIAPEPPKRTSSVSQKQVSDANQPQDMTETENEKQHKLEGGEIYSKVLPPTVTSTQKTTYNKSSVSESLMVDGSQNSNNFKETKRNKEKDRKPTEETDKAQSSSSRSKQEFPLNYSVLQRREDSLTLFARTRLGLSEGSAFTPIVRQKHIDSPISQRRTKSLDAPYVSVHHLPPADAFSSKDDTVDNNEGDMIHSAVIRGKGSFKADTKKFSPAKTLKTEKTYETTANTKSEVDSAFPQEIEIGPGSKEKSESPLNLEISFSEEKVMSGVRCARLLSKIESLEALDSEGDMDSFKLADSPNIPSDRLVNLPESVRFPSVRQISGQTSEESADGWDQKEVKVKRRTPRRSVGREEPDVGVTESVVWDSKDDEPPDDNVWDDTLVFTGKYEGSAVTDAVIPADYLKRGSCGQSIDDDNLSTPMKESSPEHWVSVDDLPEALEREEKLLRQKENILREKILNEKLKRELNLDTIEVEGNYNYGCKEGLKQVCEKESTALKEQFKGHSLDTYELTEKKLKEHRTNKNSSLDEYLLGDLSVHNHTTSFATATTYNVGSKSSYENSLRVSTYQTGIDYVQCRVVNDLTEIDQFGDNDEELEEFFVVLEENPGNEKEGKSVMWDDVDTFRDTLSNEESLISVPEEFKDAEIEEPEVTDKQCGLEDMDKDENKEVFKSRVEEKQDLFSSGSKISKEVKVAGELFFPCDGDVRSPDDYKGHQLSEESNHHSHCDFSPGKSSESRILSASEDTGSLSPFKESRRGSEDCRRLSASEDSRKHSVSESISEGTRRRLSSTDETRRKRASLTKQCSVGEESLSDDLISGVQERSSSFDHDEKDVFESETTNLVTVEEGLKSYNVEIEKVDHTNGEIINKIQFQKVDLPKKKLLEIESSAHTSDTNDMTMLQQNVPKSEISVMAVTELDPPSGEREFSKETEDSVDYEEEDLKDIREVIKEKDISVGLSCNNTILKPEFENSMLFSSFDKSASLEGEELRFIDEKRRTTPEMIMGNGREAMITSMVLANEGSTVVNKISDKQQSLRNFNKTQSETQQLIHDGLEKHNLPKRISKPKPPTQNPLNYIHCELTKTMPTLNIIECAPLGEKPRCEVVNIKSSLDSSQESDIDKLNDFSLVSRVQSQISRRNLVDAGKRLKCEAVGFVEKQNVRQSNTSECQILYDIGHPSEECKRIESGLKSCSEESAFGEDSKRKLVKEEKKMNFSPSFETDKEKRNGTTKDKRSSDQEKRDSGEDGSSSSSAPPHSKRELSSTWKPFLLESSGSSSLEEGWLPPDDNAHLADEEETSSTSNNHQDDSYRDEMDCSTGIGYPMLNVTSAEMIVSGYSGTFALSRTLSRISERSTSEQERSELEDDLTKLSSHSASVEEESIMSSDHQPSLSSDPPSPRESTCNVPDLPQDRPCNEIPGVFSDNRQEAYEPFGDVIPPPIHDEDWPSPPSSSDAFDPPVQSHIETIYMEIYPEEADKVVVKEPLKDESSSSDENRTLHDEGELLHISSDNVSVSTTTTTQDGTVIAPVMPRSVRTGSLSEDTSLMSTSDWSSSLATKPRNSSKFGTTEDLSDWTKSSTLQQSGEKAQSKHSNDDLFQCLSSGSRRENQCCYSFGGEVVGGQPDRQIASRGIDTPQAGTFSDRSASCSSVHHSEDCSGYEAPNSKLSSIKKFSKLQKEKSPTGKTFGFFETPVSKVRSPTAQSRFFEGGDKMAGGYPSLRSPTSHSDIVSKSYFYDGSRCHVSRAVEAYDLRSTSSPTKVNIDSRKESKTHHHCTPYYSNVADFAEKSYFGRYDTGSLERSKVQLSRKCCSYYSMSKTVFNDEDSSNSEGLPKLSSNTIPRASKKKKRRHKVAMDLEIRDGKIVAPPKTRTTVVENSDSDGSSPRACRSKGIRKKQSEF